MAENLESPVVLKNRGVEIALVSLDEEGAPVYSSDGEPKMETYWLRFDSNAVSDIEERWDGYEAAIPQVIDEPVFNDDEQKYETNPDGTVVTKQVTKRGVKQVYSGLEGFQAAMQVKPVGVTCAVIGIALAMEAREVGKRIPDGGLARLSAQVGVAWAMAQGVDPTEAAKALGIGLRAAEDQREALNAEIRKAVEESEAATLEEAAEASGLTTPDDTLIDPTSPASPGADGSAPGSNATETPSTSGPEVPAS